MAIISQARVSELYNRGDRVGASNTEKGCALEEVVRYIFGKVSGVVHVKSNARNSGNDFEIDVCFQHNSNRSQFDFFDWMFFVECKNLSGPAGAPAVHQLGNTLRSRGLARGILVSTNGLTGQSGIDGYGAIQHELVASRHHIVVLTRSDIEGLTSTDELQSILRRRFTYLILNGQHEPL